MKPSIFLTILVLIFANVAQTHNEPEETFFVDPKSPLCHKTKIIEVVDSNTVTAEIDNEVIHLKLLGVIPNEEDTKAILEIILLKQEFVFILFEEDENGIKKDENNIPLAYIFVIREHRKRGKELEFVNSIMINDLQLEPADIAWEQNPELLQKYLRFETRILLPVHPKHKLTTTWGKIKSQ